MSDLELTEQPRCPEIQPGVPMHGWCGCGHLVMAHDRNGACVLCAVLAMARRALPVLPDQIVIRTPDGGPLLDPDCRAGKHGSCVGGPCECACHDDDRIRADMPDPGTRAGQ